MTPTSESNGGSGSGFGCCSGNSSGGGASGGGASREGGSTVQFPEPPGISRKQRHLWSHVYHWRRDQLSKLDQGSLGTIHSLILSPIPVSSGTSNDNIRGREDPQVKRDRRRALKELPRPRPVSADDYRLNLEHLLARHFYSSVDDRVDPLERRRSLDKMRRLVAAIDAEREIIEARKGAEAGERRGKDKTRAEENGEERDDGRRKRKRRDSAANADGGGDREGASARKKPRSEEETAAARRRSQEDCTRKEKTSEAGRKKKAVVEEKERRRSRTSARTAAMGANQSREPLPPAAATAAAATAPTAVNDSDSDDDVVIIDAPPPGKSRPQTQSKSVRQSETSSSSSSPVPPAASSAFLPSQPAAAAAAAQPKAQPAILARRPRRRPFPVVAPGSVSSRNVRPSAVSPRTVRFLPDDARPQPFSSSLAARGMCDLTYNAGCDPSNPSRGSALHPVDLDDFHDRLEDWDPFWTVVHDFTAAIWVGPNSAGSIEVGVRTCPVKCTGLRYGAAPLSVAECTVCLSREDVQRIRQLSSRPIQWGVVRATGKSGRYDDGERRCIVRMLPLRLTDEDRRKRADTHLWPKGTFVQVGGQPCCIPQRRQQSHNRSLWKGMCHMLDVTSMIKTPRRSTSIELCTRDDGQYGMQVAICDYVSADTLFDKMVGKGNTPGIMRMLTYEEGVSCAMKHLDGQMVVLDSDDEGASDEDRNKVRSLTLSLLCPISKTPIDTPVRGVNCRHLQCFDLRIWLRGNAIVSGGRWRCGACESWIPPRDLVKCGLYERMLEKHRSEVSGARDRVQFRSDGTFELMEPNRLRYETK